ncbi:radical SAM/SPASM protein FxsB, inactivated metallohydrolase extension form [Streptomyces sp. NPDC002935]|uniref:radical SAM/SPASM protein FxsBH, inactivated beta-hydroxylase extension form n=1 Tax=unclassified Streptomyces TaxID=2593676 RepID=UPI003317C4E4
MKLGQLVLKIHSRCDLSCDHCYVYEHADQSWQNRPTFISDETVRKVARKFAEYAEEQRLSSVSVILHGGEPLLVGPARMRGICAEITRTITPVTGLDLRIHSNAVRLNTRYLDVFNEFGVQISVSLDGDRAANDRHRLDRQGRSTYDRVLRALDLLRGPEYRHLYSGLLCTVDVTNDPVAVHDALVALDPPRIDYLLPHSTWDSPPPRPAGSPTAYARWLLAVFDRWEAQGRVVPVRTFESILSTLRGGPSLKETLGLAPTDMAVIETDGSFELADSLKTAYAGAPETGYDISGHSFAEFARHPGVVARQLGLDGVSSTCRSCDVVESCGGGLYAHRYSTSRGFDNPSVFCADLRALVDGIAERTTDFALNPAVHTTDELLFAEVELTRHLLSGTASRHLGEADWDGVWRALLDLDGGPETVGHVDEILAHPYLFTLLRRQPHDSSADPARLASAVTAAAVRARADLKLSWDQPTPELHLPTLGTLALPEPGRVEATVTAGRLRVRTQTGEERTMDGPAMWRPLTTVVLADGTPLLLDDADPFRDCYSTPVTPPLDPAGLDAFTRRLRTAFRLMDERAPDRHTRPNASPVTTVTPLQAGSGLRLGAHGLGALGVAVDVDPEEFVRELPRAGRRARLGALRATTDLNVPGNPAGRLLDEAALALGDAVYFTGDAARRAGALERAGRALERLAGHPEGELTETGAVFADQLRTEWAGLR